MNTSKIFPVTIEISGQLRCYSLADQTEPGKASMWKHVLLKAHGKGHVQCKCTRNIETRLSVRHHSLNDSFVLARFPGTGHFHNPECRFYAPDPTMSGLGGYQKGVVEDTEDGGVKIRLNVGLQRRDDSLCSAEEKSPSTPGKKPGKAAMTLLGMLHLIWTFSGLNRWSPRMEGKRSFDLVHYQLGLASKKIKAGRVNVSQVLLLASQVSEKQKKQNHERVEDAIRNNRRLLAIAPLAQYKPAYESYAMVRSPVKAFEATSDNLSQPSKDNPTRMLPIMGFAGFPLMKIEAAVWARTLKRFEHELIAWRQGERIICIAQANTPERTKTGYVAEVTDLALMRITKDWIPVESSYEATLANWLVEQKRQFEKPLRFDAEDLVFPDFWLKDVTQADYPIEVWGMATVDYEVRKKAKIEYYDSMYGKENWWSWNAVTDQQPPPLPNINR